jgi:pimeloyl-ACP methyl ester carboxylesterase
MKALWNAMGAVRLLLGLAPATFWRRMLRSLGGVDDAATTWHACELARGSAVDLAEAGRELGRFDARRWNAALDVPAAVVVTRDDTSVPPARQRALAAGLRAPVFEAPGNHGAVTTEAREFNPVLLSALRSVAEREPRALASAA